MKKYKLKNAKHNKYENKEIHFSFMMYMLLLDVVVD